VLLLLLLNRRAFVRPGRVLIFGSSKGICALERGRFQILRKCSPWRRNEQKSILVVCKLVSCVSYKPTFPKLSRDDEVLA